MTDDDSPAKNSAFECTSCWRTAKWSPSPTADVCRFFRRLLCPSLLLLLYPICASFPGCLLIAVAVFLGQVANNSFIIHTPRASFLFFAPNAEEKQQLVTHLDNILMNLQRQKYHMA